MVDYWLLAVLMVFLPIFFWTRVRKFNRQKSKVNARCPHCGADQQLTKVSNYTCDQCYQEVKFYDEHGSITSKIYHCEACGEENLVGILTCTGCGLANTSGIPDLL